MTGDFNLDVEHCPACRGEIPAEAEACPRCNLRLYEGEARAPSGRSARDTGAAFVDTRPVFAGTLSEVMAMQAALGARGFETFIRDDSTKVIDPFITGGYCLGSTLLAPTDQAEAIAAVLAEDAARAAAPGEACEGARDETAAFDRRMEGLRDLGGRIGWCAISGILAPVGFVFAILYFHETARLRTVPRGFRLALGATLLCIVYTGLLLFWFPILFRTLRGPTSWWW